MSIVCSKFIFIAGLGGYMNSRDIVVLICFTLATSFLMQHFFPGGKQIKSEETSFTAPKEKKEYKPLNMEIDFADTKRTARTELTEVTTHWGNATFSSNGASLESMEFSREVDGKARSIRTVFPLPEIDREGRCFLVAFDEKTPFYYKLASIQEEQSAYRIAYESDTADALVRKTFLIDKEKPHIDLLLDITPKDKTSIEPRVFFLSPLMPEIKENDTISSIVIDQKDIFAKTSVDKLDLQRGWFAPSLFGADSRYFIHALIGDDNNFVARAYYKLEERNRLFSVVEGPTINEQTSWHLSFYFGPKELSSIAAVDLRLEKTLDYSGWFGPIAKVMIYLLKWFYKYLHSYGLAIIALTLLFHMLMLPFTMRGEQRMKQQAELSKKMAYLKQRYKDQPERLAAENAELIRTQGLPGMAGCLLPMLLQIPIFFSLSRVLASSFELYQAPMLWIPDLSAKDPYYILPLLLVITMLASAQKGDTQQRTTMIMAALVFGAVSINFAAGLALYLVLGRVLSFVQTYCVKYFKLA